MKFQGLKVDKSKKGYKIPFVFLKNIIIFKKTKRVLLLRKKEIK